MELYQLKTFMAVAEEQNLTRAAERMHISQPSVSTHIKALEEEFGLTLFTRTPKGMVLSPEGKQIRIKAESALRAAEAVLHQAHELKNDISGSARIGFNIDVHYLRGDELLTVLQRKSPNLEPHFFQRHSLEALNQVRDGRLDAAFVFTSPTHSGLGTKWLATFDIVIVAPFSWRQRVHKIDLKGLSEFPWIWTDDRCPFNRIIKQLFEPLKRLPEKALVADHDATVRKMVASGAGLSLMVAPEALEAARQGQLLILSDRVATLDLSLLYLKQRSKDPLVSAIIRSVCDVWLHPLEIAAANNHVENKAIQ